MKQQGKKRYFHGIINPTVNSDGSIAWRRSKPREVNEVEEIAAARWARKVVALAVGERVNPITPKDRRHI